MLRNAFFAFGILLTFLHASHATAQTSCETCSLSFVEDTLETIEISCSEGDPLQALPNFPAFTYDCTEGYWASIFKYTTGSSSSCTGNRPSGLPVNLGTIQLGEFTSTGLTSTNHFNDLGDPLTWTVYPENVARLQGTVYNNSNLDARFDVDFYFDLEGTGAEWAAAGGSFNDASADPSDIEDWTIWTLRPNISKLVGGGALEGHAVYLKESNSLQGYPLQVGTGANGVNAEHGLGGAFDWSACVDGNIYGGLGESSLEFSSCEETSSICASDNDARVEFFLGNLHGFDQIHGAVDVTDDTPPLLHDLPNDYTLNCPVELEELDALTTVFTTDDCSTASLAMAESFVNGDCPSEFTRIRTYTSTDGCGLTTQHTQTVQVIDEIDPVLNAPSNAVFSCDAGPTFTPATASDACNGPLAVTEGEQVIEQGDCPGEYTVYRTFSTEDLCGNTATGAQTIFVRDLTPPALALPADVVLPCGSEFVYPPASATDNCTAEEDITIAVFNSLPPTSCPEEYILERRFLATDLCGNSTLEIQTVTVTDNDLPYFTYVPEDATYACTEEPILEEAEADDDCSSFELTTTTDTVFGQCAANYDLIRTFTVTDACGNMADAQQVISIRDMEAPIIETVFDEAASLECDQIWSPEALDAQDNCSSVSWEMSIDTVGMPNTGNYQLNVIHTAVDACGNAASTPQTVVFSDNTAPTFVSVPADLTLSCEDDIPFDLAVATDNCTSITLEVSDDLALEVSQGAHLLTRTFTATDAQGNTTQAVQLISIVDVTAPVFMFVPADYTVECDDDLTLLDATAEDNCSDVSISVSSVTAPGNAAGNYTIVRTFTATDDAGNSSTASQTITVQDTTAPAFTFVPANYTVECSDEMPMEDATASDNCGEVTIEVMSETIAGDAAGNYTIVRTFTATDDAGNSSSATQTITVTDTTAPEFTNFPEDTLLECSDELPLLTATATDGCGPVSVTFSDAITPGDATGNYTVARTITATDDAGNTTSAVQTITVQDTTAPEFSFIPADYNVECSDEMPMDDATASDNCGEVTIEVSVETTAGDAAGNYTIVRTFTATDDAGNSVSATQTITVQDTTAPEFTFVPSDYTVECSDEMPMDDASASDNCGEVTIEVMSETTAGDAAGNYTIVRTFTATDDAGNSNSAIQTITVQDTTAPEFTFVPANYTVECSDEMPMDGAAASDNCGEVTIEVMSETIAGDAAGNYTIVRTFTATDDAGNSSSATQTITIQDTTAPEFTFVPADYTVECSDEMPMDDATASDNCGEVTIDVSSETTAGDAAGNYVIVRTFTATDDAGNSSPATQTITVQDTTAPEFTFVPADYTVECTDEMPMDDATASDNCGEVTIEVSSETMAGDATGNYTIVRTFTATDDAGNSASAIQTISVQDTTAPDLTTPEDYTTECSEGLVLDLAEVLDACGPTSVSVEVQTILGNALGNYTVIRTFTATDDAGNSTSASQTITVVDTTPPSLSIPADYTVECSEEMPMDDASASDLCGEVTIEVSSETTAGDAAGNYTIVRTFTATDDAGNSSTATQTITVQDTTAPEFTFVPADYTVECSDEMPMDDATASDNCGEVTIEVMSETTAGDAAGNYVITRTFTATDDAGNSSSATQTITVQDTTAPEFTFVPADYTVECSDEMPMDDATASDNCGEVTIEVSSETTAGDAAGNYTIVRTFTATDDAGTSSSATQTITVQDTTAPEFTFVPADYTVECSDEMPMEGATAYDNCGEVTIEVMSETTAGDAAGNYTIVRTFTAADDAGNSSTATQTITVQDTTAPEFTFVPADYTVECSDEMPMDDATASDNCGEVTIEVSSETTAGDAAGNYVIVRTFTATDDAGNSSSATQTITVQDTTAPEFTFAPADYTVECSDEMPMDDATASDNCGEVTIEVMSETTAGDAAGNYVIVRTFTATDDAGNSSSATQTITVQDTTAPEFTFVPADYTVECSDEMPMDDATASDNCGEVTIEVMSETTAGDAAGNYVIVRTFTATDDAGNSNSATQTITVQDTTAPEFTFVPADYTVECSDEMPMDDATASDNCGEVTIEVSSETTAGDATGNYLVVRTFTATDDAGNSTSATQTITVQDTTAPEFSFVPENAIVECTDPWPVDMALAFDACGPVDIQVSTDTLPGICGLLILQRTFTATDDAGNANAVVQTMTQVDTQGPTFIGLVEEVDLSCSQNFSQIPIPSATDACSEVITLVWNDVEFSGGCTLPISAIVRTYTAVDACNNVSQAEQIIQLTDIQAPAWDFLPEDMTIECTDVYELVPPTATDNCAVPQITWEVDTVGDVSTGVYDLVFAFEAVDDCDNIAEHEHVVHVEDTVSPAWVTFPEDHTMACSDALDTTVPTATDACSDVITVSLVSETFTDGECAGSGLWTRTFTATDWNGNVLESAQLIQVVDTVAPFFTSVPEAVTVECDEALPTVMAEAEDACGTTTVAVSASVIEGENGDNYTVVRTFTATDACGNEADTTQIVSVVDTTAPEFVSTWSTETRQCGEDLSPLPVETADACSDSVSVTVNDVMTPGDCVGTFTLARTYLISDVSGNTDSMLVTVNVVDSIAPVWVLAPEDITVSCDETLPTDNAEAEDVCSAVSLTLTTDTVLGNALGNYSVIQTWTAADACGNSAMHERVIEVVDTIAPQVVFPANDTVACTDEVPLTEPVIFDNCGTTSWSHMDEYTPGPCEGAGTITRTFTVTDDAGNISEGVQVISIVDEEAPEFTFVPAPATWECNAPTLLDSAMATDACSDVTLTAQLDTLSGLGANQWTLMVTWMAQDGCGNTAEATQEITVLDQLAPTIDAGPAATSLAWGDSLLLDVWESEFVYMDSCTQTEDLTVSVQIDTLEALEPCIDEVVLTWSVQDLAGNEENWIQPVQLFDNDAPVWSNDPMDLLLPCDSVWEPTAPAWTDHNDFEVTQTLDTLPGACPAEMTLTWTLLASDVCGNISEPWVQTVSFVDTLAPELVSWPEDVVVNAPADVPVCDVESIVWTDNCSDALVDCVTDTLEQYCPGSYLLGRTYSVTDACGNVSTVQQNILVEDVEGPVFEDLPNEVTYACDTTLSPPSIGELTITDNESTMEDILADVLELDSEGNGCSSFTTFRYTAMDGCGNMTEELYVQIREDNDAPFLTTALEDLEFNCLSEVPSFDDQVFLLDVEDCQSPADDPGYDVGLVATAVDEFEGGECTGPDCLLTRTVTVDDNCGNVAMFEQIIVISEPPTVPELPTGFSPNNDSFNDVYQVRNAGPDLGIPPCDWLENTTFTVFDRWGSVVFLSNDISESWDGTNLNGRPLPVGTYFVVFEANGFTYRQTVDLRR